MTAFAGFNNCVYWWYY